MHIRLLQTSDLQMVGRHRERHSKESGRNGDVIFRPLEEDYIIKDEDLEKDRVALEKPITEPGWQRIWIVTDETEVFGEVILVNRPAMKSTLHRSLLMIGIENPFRKQGWGSKLLNEAISWAQKQSKIEWIALDVFESNPSAKALYKKFGFEVVGTTPDMFRAFGESLDKTTMVLKLR